MSSSVGKSSAELPNASKSGLMNKGSINLDAS